jgi:hypothetical protein
MTEAEWLAATDPTPMLAFLRGRAGDRKFLLFGVECCRIITRNQPGVYPDVERVERLADGADNLAEVRAQWAVDGMGAVSYPERPADWCSAFVTLAPDRGLAEEETQDFPTSPQLVALFQELFGNPFRPVKRLKSWLTTDVRLLASGIYDEKAFDRLPILADALQDAGCTNNDILTHCRSGREHVRGCWALDLILGRE